MPHEQYGMTLRHDLASLKSIQGLIAPVAITPGIPLDSTGVLRIGELASAATTWMRALSTWRLLGGRQRGKVLTFRATCLRDGTHDFGSMDVAAEVGGAVSEVLGWRVCDAHALRR